MYRRNLYKSLTRSIVEYSATVWSPQNAEELIKLESVQENDTAAFDRRSYQDGCIKLHLLPLYFMRFLCKCLHEK